MRRSVLTGLLIACAAVAAMPATTFATPASEMFESGQAMLVQGDLDGALRAFRAAGRIDATNQEYAQQFAVLRQVVKMREDQAQQTDPEKWMKTAQALRSYYLDHNILGEALTLDQAIHEKQPTAATAVKLAETLLAMDKPAEAEAVLTRQSDTEVTPHVNALLGLALARQGKLDDAAVWTKKAPITADATPDFLYDLACASGLIGDATGACKALTLAFEATPPSRLEAAKAKAKSSPDFATLASGDAFTAALATASKVKESGCSSGASCGKCPSQAKCPSAADAKDADKAKAGHEPCTGK